MWVHWFLDITTCVTGVVLLVGYLASDSFTSTWQGKIFTHYQVTPMQMVFANSLLSSLLTTVSLYQVGSFKKTYGFIKEVFYYYYLYYTVNKSQVYFSFSIQYF